MISRRRLSQPGDYLTTSECYMTSRKHARLGVLVAIFGILPSLIWIFLNNQPFGCSLNITAVLICDFFRLTRSHQITVLEPYCPVAQFDDLLSRMRDQDYSLL